MHKAVHSRENIKRTFGKIREEVDQLERALMHVVADHGITNEQYLHARSPLASMEQWITEMRYYLDLQQTIENASMVTFIMSRLIEIADVLEDIPEDTEANLRKAAMDAMMRKVTHEQTE